MKDSLYYIYRIEYENLINDLDHFYCKINTMKISKDKMLNELHTIIKSNYNRVCLLKKEMLYKEDD